ncbi:MAG: magnesium transporter [Fimbriimonadaceae bacterium]|nr:magnesium transporter [Fimbriimonadaceae bacterium]
MPPGTEVKDLVSQALSLDSQDEAKELLDDLRPEDIADAIVRLEEEEKVQVLNLLSEATGAQVLIELPTAESKALIEQLPDAVVAWYLDILPMDDALDLLEDIGEERYNDLLNMIPEEDAREIQRLLRYSEGSVGRMMTERFFESFPEQTMDSLLGDLRGAPIEKYETVNDIYVLDNRRHLLGVFSLRKLLRAAPSAVAEEVMNDDVVVAQANDKAEDAARRMARYGLYALPVLDERGRMLGIFTGDDAQTVLREEDTRDVLALGGVTGSGDSYIGLRWYQLYQRRIYWLLGLFVAEFGTGMVMRHYGQGELQINPLLLFLPLLIGAGGNVGAQVTTTITRALALDEVRLSDWRRVMGRELLVASLIGLTLGFVGYLRALLWGTDPRLSVIVGLALPLIVIWAATVGSVLPIGAKRMGIDPAVMSAPFISTFVDATGLVIYFQLARTAVEMGFLVLPR